MNCEAANSVPSPRTVWSGSANAGAVVVGGDYQGLAIVRSLGRRGIPVYVVDDEQSIARFCRYTTRFVRQPDLRNERTVVNALLELGNRFGLQGWVLYPTREETVAAFSRYRGELSEMFRVPTPEWETVKWAWDKRNTYRLANDLGIPTPRTHYLDRIEQLSELNDWIPPFAVKPAIKEHFIYATKAKAWRANSHKELRTIFQKAADLVGAQEAMVQELIPGGGSQQFSYCAFFREGKAIGKMVARRRRQHPLQFGRASTYVETIDLPILEQYSERFLRAINYYGLVELEYKLDPRDSQYKLLDVNARTWGYHGIGPQAGVDFCHMLFADQLGVPVANCKAKAGIGWVRMTTDIPTAFMAFRAGEVNFRDYVGSLMKCRSDAVFSINDPLPGVAEILLVPYMAVKRGF